MQTRHFFLLPAALLFAHSASADLTLRYKSTFTVNPNAPPMIADAMKQGFGATMSPESANYIKGDKVFSTQGPLSSMMEMATGKVTLLHPPTKRYATVDSPGEFVAQMNALLPAAANQSLSGMQFDIKAQKSGKAAVIHDLPAEELVITMTIEAPAGPAPPMQIRVEMHMWMATQEAMTRFPELKQADRGKLTANTSFDPFSALTRTFGASSEKMRAILEQAFKTGRPASR